MVDNKALAAGLHEVLRVQTKGATVVLEDGTEAKVSFDGECLQAHTYGEDDEPVWHGRIRLVPETD